MCVYHDHDRKTTAVELLDDQVANVWQDRQLLVSAQYGAKSTSMANSNSTWNRQWRRW